MPPDELADRRLVPGEVEGALLALLDYALNRQGNTERRMPLLQ
jgi:hypothetical protein